MLKMKEKEKKEKEKEKKKNTKDFYIKEHNKHLRCLCSFAAFLTSFNPSTILAKYDFTKTNDCQCSYN